MAVGQKEVAVCFQADRRSAGMPYRPIPSHFEPWCQVTDNQGGSASASDALKVLEITEFLAAQQDNSVAIVIPYRRLTRVSLHGVIKQHISSLSLRKQQQ